MTGSWVPMVQTFAACLATIPAAYVAGRIVGWAMTRRER